MPIKHKPAVIAASNSLLDLVAGLNKPAAKKGTAKTYPILPKTPATIKLVDDFISLHQKFKGLEGAIKATKAQLNALAPLPYFETQEGQHTPASMIIAQGTGLNEASVGFIRKYGEADVDAVKAVVGEEIYETYFYEKLSVKVDGDLVGDLLHPRTQNVQMTAAEVRVALIQGMVELFSKYGAMDALSAKVKVTPRTAEEDANNFHTKRHTILTVEQNVSLHEILPCEQHVKVKNSNPEPVAQPEVTPAAAKSAKTAAKATVASVLAGANR